MTGRQKAKLDQQVREGIEEILARYPNGRGYDKFELLSDVRHDLDLMLKRLNISPKTPIDVLYEDGILTIRFGRFPDRN